ncbi:hypothetical protein PanWU01x14_067140 [Parasponia andersonii]|uniref:Uncharacterized protein n=1 Tax=Parasponia andersonii TaxID=3476 RepID=A0A2P5DGE5_PARAD|nr:hypothetical protein PanWU01x14_067140 [Parasponia andersonii]
MGDDAIIFPHESQWLSCGVGELWHEREVVDRATTTIMGFVVSHSYRLAEIVGLAVLCISVATRVELAPSDGVVGMSFNRSQMAGLRQFRGVDTGGGVCATCWADSYY